MQYSFFYPSCRRARALFDEMLAKKAMRASAGDGAKKGGRMLSLDGGGIKGKEKL